MLLKHYYFVFYIKIFIQKMPQTCHRSHKSPHNNAEEWILPHRKPQIHEKKFAILYLLHMDLSVCVCVCAYTQTTMYKTRHYRL